MGRTIPHLPCGRVNFLSLWHNELMAIPAIDLDKLSTDGRLELNLWASAGISNPTFSIRLADHLTRQLTGTVPARG